MWIVLMDQSASMAQCFQESEGLATFRRWPQAHAAASKMEAARASLLVQLEQIGPETEVVLVAFTSTPREVCRGRAGDTKRFEAAASALEPNNGTDIAAALRLAADLIRAEAVRLPQIVVISDGLSDVDKAVAAAESCLQLEARVDMHLIDPTDKAQRFAIAVTAAGGGRWEPVTSKEALESAGREAASRQQQIQAAFAGLEAHCTAELCDLASTRSRVKEVAFSAAFPERMAPERRYTVIVSAHLAELREEVWRSLAVDVAEEYAAQLQSSDATRIARGQEIRMIPAVPGLDFNPPEQVRKWREDRHDVRFDAYVDDPSNDVCVGVIEIQVDRLPVAFIDVEVRISSEPAMGNWNKHTVTMIERVFASYARQDAPIVDRCKEAFRALGIHLFVDRDDLLAGQPWNVVLTREIPACDLFQLYWSKSSRDSSNVAEELDVALNCAAQVGPRFIRGLYWENPMPKPPPALAESHFHQLDLGRLGLSADFQPKVALPEAALAVPPALATTILPLLGGVAPEFLADVRRATAEAVASVERITELRYYPVPTLLVDRYVIRQVRELVTVDTENADTGPVERDAWSDLSDRAGALGVRFHTTSFELGGGAHFGDPVAPWYGLPPAREEGLYRFKRYLEGMDALVRELIKRGTVYSPPPNTFQCAPDTDIQGFVRELFRRWLDLLDLGLLSQNSADTKTPVDPGTRIGMSLPCQKGRSAVELEHESSSLAPCRCDARRLDPSRAA